MSETISLGTYFFERVKQAGVHSIFGVPGDFNLALLDHIKEVDGLKWIGNANELNAGYEADGYARVNGFSCIVTTFGVGELSAVNAIAGAYAEHIPLIHVVGMPSVSATQKKLLLHHTLGDKKFDDFLNMSRPISGKSYAIQHLDSAPKHIDDLIETAILTKRPVYLGFPSNFYDEQVPKSLLTDYKLQLTPPVNDRLVEAEFIENVLKLVESSKQPIILVDACVSRHNATEEVLELAKLTKFPVFTTPMGKSSFGEDHEEFYGHYIGALSAPDVKEVVETSDCVISLGGLLSDYNTGSFSYSYSTRNVVEFHSNYCMFKSAIYDNISMKGALRSLITTLASSGLSFERKLSPPSSKDAYKSAQVCPPGILTQDYLWKRLSYFLKPKDILVAETGTSSFGILGTHLPNNAKAISQVLWGSIGFSLPAAVGAAFAAEDSRKFLSEDVRRTILFIGDGSIQLTVQAISDACRWNLKPYIFILNNNGYTIEKLIHGPYEGYNNIQPWRHQLLLDLFADQIEYKNYTVKTCSELNELFNCEKFQTPDKIRVIELFLEEFDAPESLKKQAALSEKINAA